MHRRILLLASLAVLGCDAGVAGTYALVSVNGQELPYSFEFFGTVTITSGTVTLRDSTFEYTVTMAADDGGDDERETAAGTFTLSDSNVLCVTYTPEASPPPPPAGEAGPEVAPEMEAPGPQSEPESTTDCNARWEGDRIIISEDQDEWIFRR